MEQKHKIKETENMGKTCICIGHREEELGDEKFCEILKERMKYEIFNILNKDVLDFYTDMQPGVGLWAARIIVDFKKQFPDLRLFPILAYPEQINELKRGNKKEFESIFAECEPAVVIDEIKVPRFSMLKLKNFIAKTPDIILTVYSKDRYPNSRIGQIIRRKGKNQVKIIDPYINE